MKDPLLAILRGGIVTPREMFPDLPPYAQGIARLTGQPCPGKSCARCAGVCPTRAITVDDADGRGIVTLDRGLCIGCRACMEICPSGTIAEERSTRTATRFREELVLTNKGTPPGRVTPGSRVFKRSIALREVSTGCSATDQEIAVIMNPVFDASRFGISFVASPRFADGLLVTGPVGKAMQEPLVRCYDAMAEPRLVIAAGTSAISGGLHRGGYAIAAGVTDLLPVASFIPGSPPHPWSIIHGIFIAMQRL